MSASLTLRSSRRVEAVVAGRQAAGKRRVGHLVHTADGAVESERDYRPRTGRLGRVRATEVTPDPQNTGGGRMA